MATDAQRRCAWCNGRRSGGVVVAVCRWWAPAVHTLRGMGRVGTRLCPPFSIMRGCWRGTGIGGVRGAMAAGQVVMLVRCAHGGHLRCTPYEASPVIREEPKKPRRSGVSCSLAGKTSKMPAPSDRLAAAGRNVLCLGQAGAGPTGNLSTSSGRRGRDGHGLTAQGSRSKRNRHCAGSSHS